MNYRNICILDPRLVTVRRHATAFPDNKTLAVPTLGQTSKYWGHPAHLN